MLRGATTSESAWQVFSWKRRLVRGTLSWPGYCSISVVSSWGDRRSCERFRGKLATAEYRVHRAVQEKSERALQKSFSQSCGPDAAGRGVYCGANQNTRRRKRNAPIYSTEGDRSCRCVVHGGRRAGAARKLCSRHGDGCARAEGH